MESQLPCPEEICMEGNCACLSQQLFLFGSRKFNNPTKGMKWLRTSYADLMMDPRKVPFKC